MLNDKTKRKCLAIAWFSLLRVPRADLDEFGFAACAHIDSHQRVRQGPPQWAQVSSNLPLWGGQRKFTTWQTILAWGCPRVDSVGLLGWDARAAGAVWVNEVNVGCRCVVREGGGGSSRLRMAVAIGISHQLQPLPRPQPKGNTFQKQLREPECLNP